MLSTTEENYLKALLQLTMEDGLKPEAGTNELATHLGVKPATANDMLKKLREKKLIHYEKYGKSSLTTQGRKLAIDVVRKHRLWETFLYEKLGFSWDEVHEVAEQLEHIQSQKLIDSIDRLLHYPTYDPHGDVIPTASGEMKMPYRKTLLEEEVGHTCKMVGVKDNSATFLRYVDQLGLSMHNHIRILAHQPYDNILEIEVNGKKASVGQRFAENIIIVCDDCERKPAPKKRRKN
ncbi:MAG: metal-dependent transcriptional regulator [Chitinophagaceae bacterium]|jgi:DtxR family Mn-dependent transcriptional regulator|nr:metal-dependent transcriptional regulator [Chitinophagaceae bacterium]